MKILVRGTNWIGDAVMTIPALRELNRVFPDAHLTLWTRPWAEAIFRDADFVDEIITFDKKPRRLKPTIDEADSLRREAFDAAILFTNSFESALVTRLARIPRRIGFNKDLRGLLLTDPIPVPEWKGRRHEVFYYLELVREAEKRLLETNTVSAEEPDGRLDISQERQQAARLSLADTGLDLTRKTILLGPGSTNSRAKRWPAERFAELSDRLHKELSTNVVMVGAKGEVDISASIVDRARYAPLDLTGRTGLDEVAAMLSVADLFISNDMGLAHVATAAGTPTIVIFGPTNDLTTRPFGPFATVIRQPVDCAPCMLRDCPIDHRCMTGVSVERVFDAAALRLSDPLSIITDA